MKIIVANWKMNSSIDDADAWLAEFKNKFYVNLEKLKDREIVLCPPVYMIDYLDGGLVSDGLEEIEEIAKKEGRNFSQFSGDEVKKIVIEERPIRLGAQDCHFKLEGSFTGEISPKMLAEIGCEYVILGHSERRQNNFETDELISQKTQAAISQEIVPIVCVGETIEIRNQNQHLDFIAKQVKNSVPQNLKIDTLIIAYEPVWSIGSGVIPTNEQIAEVTKLIKEIIKKDFADTIQTCFVLYGGSVSSQNSGAILAIEGVDGLLVGKASLDAEEFVNICLS